MAVKVSREASFGSGSKGFRFEVHRDLVEDQKVFEIGKGFEADREEEGSLVQQVFDRLSSTETRKDSASPDAEKK